MTSFAVGDSTDSTPEAAKIKVCKSASSNVNGSFTVSTSDAVDLINPASFSLTPGQCVIVAETDNLTGGTVTINETSFGAGSSVTMVENGGAVVAFTNNTGRSFNSAHGYTATYTNVVHPGSQGCTPGYWKQPHHFDSWQGYNTTDDFDATFGTNFFSPDITLLDALNLTGGGINRLASQGVAALLNAAAGGVNYAYTTAQVIDIVQGDGAYAGLTVEQRKNLLDAANNGVGGCPLN